MWGVPVSRRKTGLFESAACTYNLTTTVGTGRGALDACLVGGPVAEEAGQGLDLLGFHLFERKGLVYMCDGSGLRADGCVNAYKGKRRIHTTRASVAW